MRSNLSIKEIINLTGPNKKYLLPMLLLIITSSLFDAISIGLFVPLIAGIIGSKNYIGEDSFLTDITNFILAFSPNEELKLAILCGFILIVFLIKNIFVFLRVLVQTQLCNKLTAYWSEEVLRSLVTSNLKNVVMDKQGFLINNIINEPRISQKYIFGLISLSSKILVTLVLILIMITMSWQITLLMLTASFLLFSTYLFITDERVKNLGINRLFLYQQITSMAQENLNAIRQVKIFSLETQVLRGFQKKYHQLVDALFKVAIYRNITTPMAEIVIIFCLVIGLIYINYYTTRDLESYFPLFAFIVIASQKIAINLGGFASEKIALTSQKPSIIAIHNMLMKESMANEDDSSLLSLKHLDGDIIFKDVSFTYEASKKRNTLNNVNLIIKKNKITLITGPSGSGKSTIIDLICGFFKNYEGSIFYGRTDISHLNLASLRNNIAFISQDSFLFDLSIKENILLGNSILSDDEIRTACKRANADEFINAFPDKYETQLVDRGQNISGGQRQRLTIARALARDFDLLIIDEGLSALDKQTAEPIINYLKQLRDKGKTIILVSHNKDFASIADQSIVIDSGVIKK